MAGYPEPNFTHLLRLSEDVGTLEHGCGSVPLREHGYCVDDAARAAKVSMVDEETGGGADGLHRKGRSENQGAESALALLSTLQHGRRLDGSSRGR
jgi:hypothetical protein